MLITVLFMTVGGWFTEWSIYLGIGCPEASGGDDSCFTSSAYIRMSFALAVFSLITLLAILPRGNASAQYHDGWWCFKFLLVAGLFTGAMWIPNEPYMVVYMHFSRVVSLLFLAYQAVLMLIVFYIVNEILVNWLDTQGGEVCTLAGFVLIASTLLLTVGNVVWIYFQF